MKTLEDLEKLYAEGGLTVVDEFQPVAYVAGPYRSKGEWDLECKIASAEYVALNLWRMGYAVICPHKNTAHFGGAYGLPDQVWLDGDLSILARCDLIVAIPGWENSSGTIAELNFAADHDIPALFWEIEEDVQRLANFDFRSNA